MHDKKISSFESPDLKKLKAVVIDNKTTIYIDPDTDADEARKRYLSRINLSSLKI
jgi:hypothetical protein